MIRKNYLLGALAMLPLFMMSCKSTAYKTETRSITATHNPVLLEPKYVEYTVNLDKKAEAMVEGKLEKGEDPQIFVNKAIAQAAINSGADFLFEPTYEVEKRKRKITARASGYPAKYTNVRKLNFNDPSEVRFYTNHYGFDGTGVDSIKVGKKKRFLGIF